jgi:hypothetical protein
MDVLWDSDAGSDGDDAAGGAAAGGASGSDAEPGPPAEGGAGSGDEGGDGFAVADDDDAPPEMLLVDDVVPREEVLARIEAHTAALLRGLAEQPPRVPELQLASRRQAGAVNRKRLTSARDGAGVVRLWRVMAEIHGNLRAGRSATQRELYCACLLPCACASHRAPSRVCSLPALLWWLASPLR